MGRLIDEDILIKRIYEYQSKSIDTDDIIHSIKTLPTAYDVEAVVAKLEELRQGCRLNAEVYTARKIEKAIEIVRGKE